MQWLISLPFSWKISALHSDKREVRIKHLGNHKPLPSWHSRIILRALLSHTSLIRHFSISGLSTLGLTFPHYQPALNRVTLTGRQEVWKRGLWTAASVPPGSCRKCITLEHSPGAAESAFSLADQVTDVVWGALVYTMTSFQAPLMPSCTSNILWLFHSILTGMLILKKLAILLGFWILL